MLVASAPVIRSILADFIHWSAVPDLLFRLCDLSSLERLADHLLDLANSVLHVGYFFENLTDVH